MNTHSAEADDPQFLQDAPVDRLAQVCLELAAELWTTRERLAVLEGALVDADVVGPVDDLDVTDHREHRPETRDAFIAQVLGPLLPQ